MILVLTAALTVLPSMPVYADGILKEKYMYDETLQSTELPSGTRYVGTRAYYGCPQLESVTIPAGCRRIGESAFAMCPKLSYVSLPSSVETIEPGAFAGCTALADLTFSRSNPYFFYSDHILYDPATSRILSCMPARPSTYYNMPDSVKYIDKYAFWGTDALQKVIVSNQVESITPYDFAYCHNLKWIYLPESVKTVQEYAFRDCRNLELILTENPKLKIDPTAFYNGNPNVRVVSGANLEEFKSQYYTEEELEDEKKAKAEGERVERERNGLSGNTASGNLVSGNSTVGKWDPATTSYTTRDPQIKAKLDSLTKWLSEPYRGQNAPGYPTSRLEGYPGGYVTITPRGSSAAGSNPSAPNGTAPLITLPE